MVLLVAYDDSAPSKKALKHAFQQYPDEEFVLLRVVEMADGSTGAGIGLAKEKLEELRSRADGSISDGVSEIAESDEIEFRTETAVGQPAREIVAFAEEHEIDHIFVGSHGRSGVSRVLLGSVAETVVRRAPVPVTVVR